MFNLLTHIFVNPLKVNFVLKNNKTKKIQIYLNNYQVMNAYISKKCITK